MMLWLRCGWVLEKIIGWVKMTKSRGSLLLWLQQQTLGEVSGMMVVMLKRNRTTDTPSAFNEKISY